jgi:ketosteroid isomerase-like protein
MLCVVLACGACAGGTKPMQAQTPASQVDSTNDGFSLNVYRNVVRGKVIAAFDAMNARDAGPALALMADDVHYRFEGDHALGGERFSKRAVETWFGRLFRLVPSRFVVLSVEVAGWPWSSTVTTVFEDHVTPRAAGLDGDPYVNRGVQVIRLRWGKAVDIQTTVDTTKLVCLLDGLAARGIAEAAAPPITD